MLFDYNNHNYDPEAYEKELSKQSKKKHHNKNNKKSSLASSPFKTSPHESYPRRPLIGSPYVNSTSKKIHKKSVRMYAVFSKASPDIPVTFTSSFDEATHVAQLLIYKNHYAHFKLWCALHNISPVPPYPSDAYDDYLLSLYGAPDPSDPDADFDTSFSTKEIPDTDIFSIKELSYSPDDIASFLRMFTQCFPLDLRYDHLEEYERFILDNGLLVDSSCSKDPITGEP